MRLTKALFLLLIALSLFAVPAISQDTTDHNDTNSKTKKAAKKAADKTKDAAKTTADDTKKVAEKTKDAAVEGKNKVTGNMLDINTATKDQLMALPGIGDKYSDAIIRNRPYTMKNQIVSKAGVPQGTYDKIKDQIIAHKVASGDANKPTAATKQKKTATAPAQK